MVWFLIWMTQEKSRHFVVEQTTLRAVREIVWGFLKSPGVRDDFADREEGPGQNLLIPGGIGYEQELSAQVA